MFVGESKNSDKDIKSSDYYCQAVLDCQIIRLRTFFVHVNWHQSPFWQLIEREVAITDRKWD
jgi:hypothetical protein